MKISVETSSSVNTALPFSETRTTGNLVFTSGQIYLTPEGKLLEGTIEEQTHQVMKNLRTVLKEAGVNFKNVVKTTIYVTDLSEFKKISEVYVSYISQPYPARETVCVKELALGAKLEISMIAAK